ncbi:MAG TPA: hypothetical protein VFV50_19385 [Bdellovibrionales bacterium]|nr:hypothetical protein [Bdellovibrionales bacterium]
MIIITILMLSNLYLLGVLTWRQEYLMIQLIVLTQVWLALVLIPFVIRGETRLSQPTSRYTIGAVAVFVLALAGGLSLGVADFWLEPSGFSGSTKALLGTYAEVLPVVGTTFAVAVLAVSGFLRGRA